MAVPQVYTHAHVIHNGEHIIHVPISVVCSALVDSLLSKTGTPDVTSINSYVMEILSSTTTGGK